MSSIHWMDYVLAWSNVGRTLFRDGFGDTAYVDRLLAADPLAESPLPIDVEWSLRQEIRGELVLRGGTFRSPSDALPSEVQHAHFRLLLPRVPRPAHEQPVYVVLAASGEEGFARRTRIFTPMVRQTGIGVLLLENPYYGLRRPAGQKRADIRTVSDMILMNVAVIEEARSLLAWLGAQGHTRLGITGFSMGASVAAIVAARWEGHIATSIVCASRWASRGFTRGLLSRTIDFARLGRDAGSVEEARAKLVSYVESMDLHRHPLPRCLEATVVVGAERDGYFAASDVRDLQELWQGCASVWLPTGHAGALVYHAEDLRRAAAGAMLRLDQSLRERELSGRDVHSDPAPCLSSTIGYHSNKKEIV